MKKILMICVAIATTVCVTSNANAQVKVGFFDDQQILALMPGISKIDTLLQKFAADSLAPERDALMDELKRQDSLLKDSAKLPASLKTVLQKQAAESYYKLQNWQQYQQQVLQQKQEQLLAPFKKPIYDALKEVIAEQKYTLILKPESVVWADKSDELPLRVLGKLSIANLPKEIEEQVKPYRTGKTISTPQAPATAPKIAPAKPKGKG